MGAHVTCCGENAWAARTHTDASRCRNMPHSARKTPFIQKAKQTIEMIGNFLSSIGDIAAGNISGAAAALQAGLARGRGTSQIRHPHLEARDGHGGE